MNHCHDCQFLRPANGGVRCAKAFRVKYLWPEGSDQLVYGYHAVHGCGTAFRQRTSAYYEDSSKRGPKPKDATRCPKDTDGDGDCAECARTGVCTHRKAAA